jgi:hypothetical protein
MNKKNARRVPHSARSSHFEDPSPFLLELWLSLPADGRDREFAGTSRAADLAGVAIRTMQDWVSGGIIPSVRIGSRYRIHLPSMRKVLEARSQPLGQQQEPREGSK